MKHQTPDDLVLVLTRIDGRGYKAYKDIAGSYRFPGWTLFIDHVQGDPFASPSKVRLRVESNKARVPSELFDNRVRRMALQDFLARRALWAIERLPGRRGSGKSGLVTIDAGAQEVLERTALVVTRDWVEARLQVGLPAAGRSVLGRQAEAMLCNDLPQIVDQALCWERSPEPIQKQGRDFVHCVENQEHIRHVLEEQELVAFVADGAVLPRQSGATDRPLVRQAVAFRSPDSRRITINVPHPVSGSRQIKGMGIPRGVTLIVGGGYHGKSTLLKALERGVYPHIPGDGREYVVTNPDAVKIRAEDGRRVERVDISPFISNLPYGRSTTAFSTEDASGSTSQAANIMEALEVGAQVLLLDEDTSATNFMVRDARMQSLVHKEHEPITPFLDRIREIYDKLGISTVLVMGGCGDYFEVADTVLMMRDYLPREVTEEAKTIAREHTSGRSIEAASTTSWTIPRIPRSESFDPSRGKRDIKIDVKGLDSILFGRDRIDLRSVEQLVDRSQTHAVGQAIHLAAIRFMDGGGTLREVVEQLGAELDLKGLDILDPFHRAGRHPGNFARPRKYEIAAAMNRLRTVRMKQKEDRP
jgi:predicted ABC-class ATPase